ncbi:MAG: phosphoadenylyl-sulfate reductase [Acidobacteriota bacterium]
MALMQAESPSVPADLDRLRRDSDALPPAEFIQWSAGVFGDGLVVSTSFGVQSAVMLHLVTRVVPRIPVIWVDTGYLLPETYRFAEELTRRLNLNLKVYQSPISPARMEALYGRLWALGPEELDRYHLLRKVEPMRRALRELGARAWLSGLRRQQTSHRNALPRVDFVDGYYKLLPILDWTSRQVHEYLQRHGLPYHPLFDRGYVSVGDWHSSRPLSPTDTHERDTRFGGVRQECGLHLPLSEEAAASLDSSKL